MKRIFNEYQPEIVFHLAAQPLVRLSYDEPVDTWQTNVMGTINVMEAFRQCSSAKVAVMITTDKCYENREQNHAYTEDEPMGGYDPYSSSKGACEIAISSWRRSFMNPAEYAKHGKSIASVRAGNVIGGGDWAKDRIIPDCVKSALSNQDIIIRNPHSIRPYQHVLEPLNVYLTIVKKQYEDMNYSGYYNVGPDDEDCISTGKLATLFCDKWGNNLKWINKSEMNAPHEANFLKLNTSKIKETFNWKSKWNIDKAVEKTVEWTKHYMDNENMGSCTDKQIEEFFKN